VLETPAPSNEKRPGLRRRALTGKTPRKAIVRDVSDKINLARSAYLSLENIRQELLETKVAKKKDVRKVHENESIKETLKQFVQESSKGLCEIQERNRLISQGR
jgi:hypothetical protein